MLDLVLESIKLNLKGYNKIYVFYESSDEIFLKGYEITKKKYIKIFGQKIFFIRKKSLAHTTELFYRFIENDILILTDDSLIFKNYDLLDDPASKAFYKEDKIISGGNFHGQPLALIIDFLKISLSELGNISERRTFNLMSGKRNLPSFLTKNPGLNSGLMIIQYTAASLVSANKQLSTPSSIDSITSSNGQEDHVSMGANGANQLREICSNLYDILAVELISAAQAKDFNIIKSSKTISEFLKKLRGVSPKISNDKIMYVEIKKVNNFIKNYKIKNLFL